MPYKFNPFSGRLDYFESSATLLTGMTEGSVLFVAPGPDFGEDNTNLRWDDVANRLIVSDLNSTNTTKVSWARPFLMMGG